MQVAFYAPDSYFVNSAAKEPAARTMVHDTHPADNWHPGMACASTEDFWFTDQNNGPAIAKFLGDKAAISTNLQFSTGRGMWWGKLVRRRLSRRGGQRHGRLRPEFPGAGDAVRRLRHARTANPLLQQRKSTAA